MSTTGLQSGLYREIRELAELFDTALIALKSTSGSSVANCPQRLGAVLLRLANPLVTEPHDQLLASLLAGSRRGSRTRLSDLGNALMAGTVSPRLLDDLEDLAGLLEQERAGTFAKIRGHQ